MGLLDSLKKKEPQLPLGPLPPPPPPMNSSSLPIQQVLQMEQQGRIDQEIVAELQKQGFDQTQIYDAIVQARQRGGPEPFTPQQQPAQPQINVQEQVERVVEEKWQEIQKELSKIHEWKEKVELKSTEIETKVGDLKADLENLHKAIVGKIGEYDRNLMDVGVEMKAMEQVFKKVLPELSSNVQELARITKKVKEKQAK